MISEKQYFKLFANCIPNIGDEHIYIIDYHSISYLQIDNFIYDLVTNKSIKLNIEEIKNDPELGDEAIKILNFLVDNNFGFFVDDVTQYPNIDLNFSSPETINNAIIELENMDNYNFTTLLSQLNDLYCGKVEIWVKDKIFLERLVNLVADFEDSFIRTIQIIINYKSLSQQDVQFIEDSEILKKLRKVELIIYNSDVEKTSDNFYFTKEDFSNSNYLTSATNSLLHINLDFYLESLNHNVFLNKKVCIDGSGNIKNFLSFNESFGNVNNDLLADIVKTSDFQKLWFVNNDKINQIKHSPFKYCFPILDEPVYDSKTFLYNITLSDCYPWNTELEIS
ncbi:hypothetical protein [Epilithonimonas hominis]|uniref:hypothetical protein n=1 Tax=Epilithonimonas hominis TaxID=420404 RepID=UPI002898F4B5|nr:hypothetical protein [Epilithonimonas hominis]